MGRWDISRPAVLVAVLCLAAVAAAASVLVEVESTPGFDPAGCRTFSWRDGMRSPDPLIEKTIRQVVEGQLAKRGARQVAEAARCWVSTSVLLERPPTTGALKVEIGGADWGEPGWRGLAVAAVGPQDEALSVRQKRVRKAVKKMFRTYPKVR